MDRNGILVIGVYSHPEYFPPTLNAIEFLSSEYEHIYVVHRSIEGLKSTEGGSWEFPGNVTLLYSGKTMTVRAAESLPIVHKIKSFLLFSLLLLKTINLHKAKTILLYDYLPILSYRLIRHFAKKPVVLWYHNHDVAEKGYLRKGSLSWWGWKSEQWIFPRLTIFTLPSLERKTYFPMGRFKGTFFFLPNFPSKTVFARLGSVESMHPPAAYKILYHGSIGPFHGLEEIIPLLVEKIEGKELYLVIKGFIDNDYLDRLKTLALKHNVIDRLVYLKPSGYSDIVKNTNSCQIGIGIYKKDDIMNRTMGTAGNKIYEYAAAGLPVLIYDNDHFRSNLNDRQWVFFTDTSRDSLMESLRNISDNYESLSQAAKMDFEQYLCYENFISPVLSFLNSCRANQ